MEISVPWPVANREAVVDCFGVDLLEQHKFVVFMKSVDQHPKIAIPAVKDGAWFLAAVAGARSLA